MMLFSSNNGLLGGQFTSRGSVEIPITAGESGDYTWSGITAIELPTRIYTENSNQPWVWRTAQHTGGSWRILKTSTPYASSVSIPIDGTGEYSATVNWNGSVLHSGGTAEEGVYSTPNGSAWFYIRSATFSNKSTLYMTVSETGIATSWLKPGTYEFQSEFSPYTSHYSALTAEYRPGTWTQTHSAITSTSDSAFPSGTGWVSAVSLHEGYSSIVMKSASAVSSLGSGISVYGSAQ